MKIRRWMALALALIMALSALTGCSSKPADEGTPTDGTPREDLILQLPSEPATLDSQLDSSVLTQVLAGNLHDNLVGFDNDGNVVGELAESWTWNEDYTEVTFKLREGIKFSDGSAITAEDVVYSYERIIETGISAYTASIAAVESPEEGVVVVKLNQSNAIFLNGLALSFFNVFSKAAMEGGMDIAKLPNVTSGPYYLETWNVGSDLVLKANPNYWAGEAAIKTVKMPIIGDENTALIALDSGDIDIMQGGGNLTGSSVTHIEESENFYLIENQKATYTFLSLNQDLELFADINVRKAIDCAIDREAVIMAALDGRGEAASIPVTDYLGGYVDGYSATKYDVEKAKEYLKASNYPDGFTFSVQSGTGEWTKALTIMQMNLKDVGITMNIEEVDVSTAISNISTGNYEGCVMSWGNASGDVTNLASMFTAGEAMQFSRIDDPAMGELLAQSNALEGAEREAVLKEFYDLCVGELPYISLYWPVNYWGVVDGLVIDAPLGLNGYVLYSMHWA